MMQYILIPVWAAFQIWFAVLFLGSFFETKRRTDEIQWIVILTWLLTAIFGYFQARGFHSYLMYLLSVVLILLTVYGEYGAKGLSLLTLCVIIPVVMDQAVQYLVSDLDSLPYYLTVTFGKALPALLIFLLRRLHLLNEKTQSRQDQDMLLLRQHMEMQQESMAALEANFRLQRKSAHEFEHHLQVLRDLLDRNETDAARDYLHRLKKNRSIHVMSVSSNHPVIDVILNQKYQTARENEIKMQITVNDLSAVTVPSDSLVVILTNLLDNAIEACRRIDGYREICCSILFDDGLYISVRNTSKEVAIVDGKILTSKADSLSHGFGLQSVTYVLEELGAEYTFGYDEGWFHFAAEME